MLTTLFAINLHFSLYLLGALVLFASGWLHFDSWKDSHRSVYLFFLSLGYMIVSVSWLGQAIQSVNQFVNVASASIQTVGLIFIAVGLLFEPLLAPPSKVAKKNLHQLMIFPMTVSTLIFPVQVLLSALIAFLYIFKATRGYQKQLWLAGIAFIFMTITKAFEVQAILKDTVLSVPLQQLLADYGPVWYIQKIFLALTIITFAVWIWSYLRFRFRSQLFLTFTGVIITIFVVTTSGFTWLLMNNLELSILASLRTDLRVFQYALEKTQLERLAINKSIAGDDQLTSQLTDGNTSELAELANQAMLENETSFLHLIDPQGLVVIRAEDDERKGDSRIDEALIKQALSGFAQSDIIIDDTLVNPLVLIAAATPIENQDDQIEGVVSSGYIVDTAFVEGIKSVTGLEATVYAGPQRVATTLVAEDGVTSYINTQESNPDILETVLERGEYYIGKNRALNIPYFVAYAPIRNTDGEVVGMLSVSQLQTSLEELTADSIRSTFVISIGLILVLIGPIYFFSTKIEEYLNV